MNKPLSIPSRKAKIKTRQSSHIPTIEGVVNKILHDIAGEIGAINSGIEFFKSSRDDQIKEEAFNLTHSSAKMLWIKYAIFRQLFNTMDFDSCRSNLEEYLAAKKISLIWNIEEGSYIRDEEISQVITGLCMISASFLIYGGQIKVNIADTIHRGVTITASAKSFKVNKEVIKAMHYIPDTKIDFYNIVGFFIGLIMNHNDLKLRSSILEQDFSFIVSSSPMAPEKGN